MSIEDVLGIVAVVGPTAVVQQADALAAADLPLVDRERGIAVIRLDPELAQELRVLIGLMPSVIDHTNTHGRLARYAPPDALRRAARIIGGADA